MPRHWLLVTFAFAIGWLVLSEPWLFSTYTIPYDAKAHFQAQIQFLAQSLSSGQSPFWTPNVFAGSPQIADPQSLIFSPALLLALFTSEPSFRVVDAYVLGLLGLGGLAAGWFALDRGWHPVGATVAALAFAFGASAAWRIQHIGQIKSYVFFAVTLWLLARCLDRASWRWGVAAGAAAATMIAEPDQVALLGCYVLAGFVAHHWLSAGAILPSVRRSLPGLLAAAAVCVGLAIFPLLFTVLFAQASNRPAVALTEALSGSLHPASFLTMVVSDLFGAFDPGVPYWGPSSTAWGGSGIALTQNMGQLYLGMLPALAIAVMGVGARRAFDPDARFLTGAALFTLVYALGTHTPLFEAFHSHLPGVAQFRRPADATFILGGCLSLLAGYLVHCWIGSARDQRALPGLFAGLLVVAAAFVLSVGVAARTGRLDVALPAIAGAFAWLCLGLGALVAVRAIAARPGGSRVAVAASTLIMTGVLVADLKANNGPNESTALPHARYEVLSAQADNETVKLLRSLLRRPATRDRRPRVELTGLGFEWPNAGLVQGFENVFGYNPLRLGDFNAATGSPDTIAAPDQRRFTRLFPSYKSTFANMFCLRYIATGAPVELIDRSLRAGDLVFIARTKDAYIYENPDALPRVLFADRYRVADFDDLIATGRWPQGFDPTREVLLEAEPDEDVRDLGGDDHGGYARLVSYRNTEVEIEVEARRPGFVVLNDVYHPWWRASVDGTRVPIAKANVLFRAVQVPAGRHRVTFEFRPVEGSIAEVAELLWPTTESP